MSKKIMVLALATACAALFALPAAASAQTAHLSATTSFSVTGNGGSLTSTEGGTVNCSSTTGSGTFSTTTSGHVSLLFHGCSVSIGFSIPCTSPSHPSGTITAANSFNLIMVSAGTSTGKAGILLTPTGTSVLTPSNPSQPSHASKKFVTEFSCGGIQSIKVYGNGVIGTIHQACSTSASTFGLVFESSSPGHQKHMTWTGTTYDLISNITDQHPTASLDGTATIHLPAARQLHCT
jgi:hypothetical protein